MEIKLVDSEMIGVDVLWKEGESTAKPFNAFHDVAVGVGISRKNGGDGVKYQAVRDTLDPGPAGQGRLTDIKPKDEM